MRVALTFLAVLCLQFVVAQCDPKGEAISLNIQDFGSAQFSDFTLDAGRNAARFWGGVCLHAADGSWTVEAETIDIVGLQPGRDIAVSATEATLVLPDWFMTAEELTSDGHVFAIRGGTFSGSGLAGSVAQVRFNLDDGVIEGQELIADGPGYRVTGDSALFHDDRLTLRGAAVTTCKCKGEPAYVLTGSEATLSLTGEIDVTLYDGVLRLGFITMELEREFKVTNDSLSGLSPPLTVGWEPEPAGENPRGYGFTVAVPPFGLNDQTKLEFGITGLDNQHPLSGWMLLDVKTEFADLLAGYTRGGGPRADFSVRNPLNDWLTLTIAGNNRHYSSQSYLHEGLLTLATTLPRQDFDSGAQVSWGASMTAAVSSQIRSGTSVVSPRLRNTMFVDWRLPDNPVARASLRTDFELSIYSQGRDQYGLRLRPTLSRQLGPVNLTLAHDLQLTDAGSPFSSTLDLLAPINRTTFTAGATEVQLAEGTSLDASFGLRWNWLRFPGGEYRGFENLSLNASLEVQTGDWTVEPALRLQLAGVLDPRPTSDREAFIEAGVAADSGDIEVGLLARHHLGGKRQGLELLELSGAYPFQLDDVRLVPFVALNFAPLVTGNGGLEFSGHGLLIEWDSCCGLFELGYRVHGGDFTTTLSAEFIR